jgi:phage FluMu protein Com
MTLVAASDNRPQTSSWLEQSSAGEIVVLCPHCKALQTLQITGGQLTPTRKFTQDERHIYHDCGSRFPCRLYLNL